MNKKVEQVGALVAQKSNTQLAEATPIAEFAKLKEAGTMVAQSQFFGNNISAAGGAMIIMTMYKENLSPVEFKRRYHMVGNTPSRVTNSLLGDFKLAGGKYSIIRADAEVCEIKFVTAEGEEYTQKVTMEAYLKTDTPYAKDGKTLKDNWKNNPDDMLFARCCAKALRRIAPELMGGIYSTEEQIDIEPKNVELSPSEVSARLRKEGDPKPEEAAVVVEPEKPTKKTAKPKAAEVTVVPEGGAPAQDGSAAVAKGEAALEKAKAEAEEKAKAELAAKRKAKEEQEKAAAQAAQAQAGQDGVDFEVCPTEGKLKGKKWIEMENDVLVYAYQNLKGPKHPEILDGHIAVIEKILTDRGVLQEDA